MRKRFLSAGIAAKLRERERVFDCIFKAQNFVRQLNRIAENGEHYRVEACFRSESGEFLGFVPCRIPDNEMRCEYD